MKNVFKFSQYFPVMNIFNHNATFYSNQIEVDIPKLRNVVGNKYEVDPKGLKQFLIDQFDNNQINLQPEKEIIFIGRSNVGKSSLLNILLDEKVSRTSKSPGCTKKLYYHYLPKLKGFIIDCPGYGYSDINVDAVKRWHGMIDNYIQVSPRLCRVYLLINIEHGLKESDEAILTKIQNQNLNIQLVLTKSDKLKDEQVYDKMLYISNYVNKRYQNVHPLLHAVSSKTKFGIDPLRCSIIDSLRFFKPRDVEGKEELLIKYLQSKRGNQKLSIKYLIKTMGVKQNKNLPVSKHIINTQNSILDV